MEDEDEERQGYALIYILVTQLMPLFLLRSGPFNYLRLLSRLVDYLHNRRQCDRESQDLVVVGWNMTHRLGGCMSE
jgi:hypothetical protein